LRIDSYIFIPPHLKTAPGETTSPPTSPASWTRASSSPCRTSPSAPPPQTGKYQYAAASREADPVSLGEKRARTYRDSRRTWKISSPTIPAGYIWQALTAESQARFDYFVRCPSCGGFHTMQFSRIR